MTTLSRHLLPKQLPTPAASISFPKQPKTPISEQQKVFNSNMAIIHYYIRHRQPVRATSLAKELLAYVRQVEMLAQRPALRKSMGQDVEYRDEWKRELIRVLAEAMTLEREDGTMSDKVVKDFKPEERGEGSFWWL